jgi:endonuclease III
MSKIEPILDFFVEEGKKFFDAPRKPIQFTDDETANALVNDIENTPHAFFVACLMDTQIKAEKAWRVPLELKQRMGNFRFETLKAKSCEELEFLMSTPTCLHRYVANKSLYLYEAIQRIDAQYGGWAANLWEGGISSAEVVFRFLEFKGFGPKLSTMAANILAREFKVKFADYYSIDISADVHVKRVFKRLGIVPEKPSVDQVIYRARALYPEFPGLLDLSVFNIGRSWCHTRKPNCSDCPLTAWCEKNL